MAAVLNRVTKQYLPSANTPEYPVSDWIINPDLSAVAGFDSRYWTVIGDTVSLMSPAERAAVDAASATSERDAIASDVDGAHPRIIRALAELLVDEFNAHATKMNALLDAIDAASSLATLKTAVAGIANHPDRTLAQLKTAIRNKLNG